jgi:GntR family transcriptional regulator
VVLEKNHFSMAYSYLENENLSGSLYGILQEYGVEPKQATHDISMVIATEAQGKLLEVETGTPLMKLHEVVYDQKGRPLHNSVQLIRGDRFVFRI